MSWRGLSFEQFPLIALSALLVIAFLASVRTTPTIGLYGSQHIHADFLMQIGDQAIDFSLPEYQTTNDSVKSPLIHLHDGNGKVVHAHATGLTWGHFLQSLGFSQNATCLRTDTEEQYCTNATHVLSTYVNGHSRADRSRAQIRDLDRAVFTYLPRQEEHKLNKALMAVSDEACIPSGKCPERGAAQPEQGCGIGDCLAGE